MMEDIETSENLKDIEKERLIENETNCVFTPCIFLLLVFFTLFCCGLIIYVIFEIFII